MLDTGLNMKKTDFIDIIQLLSQPEIDYASLMVLLGNDYQAPARKLQELIKGGYFIRLKKGFYVLNPKKSGKSFRPEVVANLLYGPSYLSLEYALAHYGLIPERVLEMTSVTSAKNKIYKTKLGTYSYQHLSRDLYPQFTKLEILKDGGSYLIATPEKALFDFLVLKTNDLEFNSSSDLTHYLENNLRINWPELVRQCDIQVLKRALPYYVRRKRVKYLIDALMKEKK